MLQRYIQTALEVGTRAYLADPMLYQSLFGDIWGLQAPEIAAIRAYFAANPPVFYQGYPRAALDARPSGYIQCVQEGQPDLSLNDYGGSAPTVGPQGQAVTGLAVLSSIWSHTYSIFLVTRGQPEPTLWFYEMCKSSLLAAKHYFLTQAVQNYTLSGGEVAPETAYAPDTLFARTLQFRCQREFRQVDQNSTLAQAFSVSGLVLPPGGDPLPGRPDSHINVALPTP